MKNKINELKVVTGLYYVAKDGQSLVIRQHRIVNGKQSDSRLSKDKYKHLAPNREALQAFVDKLNFGINLKEIKKIEIESAFLPPKLIETFKAQLELEIPNKKDFKYIFHRVLKEYFLNFFVNTLQNPDPKDWPKKQSLWISALLDKHSTYKIFDFKASPKTIKTTIQTANRFMKFLNLQDAQNYPLYEFDAGKGAMKTYKAEYEAISTFEGKFITDEHWKLIKKKLTPDIEPFVKLMYCYGLRRGESLGFSDLNCVRKGYLKIDKQLKSYDKRNVVFSVLKDKEQRQTPHWFCELDEVYNLIAKTLDKKMHPDTLSTKFDALMNNLGMEYTLHDLRRTFITKALRIAAHRDVQLAVGHTNIETTMKYAQDDRSLDEDVYIPKKKTR